MIAEASDCVDNGSGINPAAFECDMASIKHKASGDVYQLFPGYQIGRGHTASLRLVNRLVSSEHASFRWTGTIWELCDLASRNGTYVNGKRLDSGDHCALLAGYKLAFGDAEDVFELVDDAPPEPMAAFGDGELVFGDCGVLALPSSDEPQLMIHAADGGAWIAIGADRSRRTVKTGDTVECAGHGYRLTLPDSWLPTWQLDEPQLDLDDLGLRFVDHGPDKHPSVTIVHAGRETTLRPRAHNRMLLELARQRLEDQVDPKLSEPEHGWMDVEELCVYLAKISQYQLNLYVCRARAQLRVTSVLDPQKLIERGQSTASSATKRPRQIRIGIADLEIRAQY